MIWFILKLLIILTSKLEITYFNVNNHVDPYIQEGTNTSTSYFSGFFTLVKLTFIFFQIFQTRLLLAKYNCSNCSTLPTNRMWAFVWVSHALNQFPDAKKLFFFLTFHFLQNFNLNGSCLLYSTFIFLSLYENS